MQLSIIQYKDIIELLKTNHGFDLTGYALFSLKRNLGMTIDKNHFTSFERFKEQLKTDKRLLDSVIEDVISDYTSLFREPSVWRMLRDQIIPDLLSKGRIKIWMPDFSLEELYTLIFILNEKNCIDKTSIFTTHINKKQQLYWRQSQLPKTDLLQAQSNLKRYNPELDEQNHIQVDNGIITLPDSAKRIVNFVSGDALNISPVIQPNLVLYRNQMIYFNHVRQHKMLKHIHKNLNSGGYLVLGAREELKLFDINDQFKQLSTEEQIYRRKI